MKTALKHIFSIVLALFFVLAGSGINIVKYCCASCYEHGIEEVARKSCGSFHHHEDHSCCANEQEHPSNNDDDIACSNINHHPSGCHMLRLNVETPTMVNALVKNISLPLVLFFNPEIPALELLKLEPAYLISNNLSPKYKSPPEGRQILSLKCVLTI